MFDGVIFFYLNILFIGFYLNSQTVNMGVCCGLWGVLLHLSHAFLKIWVGGAGCLLAQCHNTRNSHKAVLY